MFDNWDDYFMTMAYIVSLKSKDESTKVGSIIVGPDHEIRTTGYNGIPRGTKESPERSARPKKYLWFEHAERNAFYNAARVGIPLKGCSLYVTSLPPCTGCARGMIQTGISRVVMTAKIEEVPERWKEDCVEAYEMLLEAGVELCVMPIPKHISVMFKSLQEPKV